MRSSILLSSLLAIGAIAKPLVEKRYYVTEVDLEIKTVTVYVTPGAPEPTVAAISTKRRHRHSYGHPKPSSQAAPKPSSVYTPPAYTPAPTPTPTPSPVQSSKAPASSAPAYDGTHKSGDIQATFTSGPDYEAMVLYHHNAARANHGASPLAWDAGVANAAKWWADKCNFTHDFPDQNALHHGQNIFARLGDAANASAGITESWYKGELPAMMPYFGQSDLPSNVFHEVGHLTQMVWKETTKVGCASVDCSGKMITPDGKSLGMNQYLVCNYAGAGNVGTQYAKNVQAPISTTNLGNWDD